MSIQCKQCQTEMEQNSQVCPKCGTNQEGELVHIAGFVPTLEVFRESCFVGCLLSYKVFVDDKEIGWLKNGEKKRFQLEQGLHEIQIKQNWSWFSSPKESFLLKDFVKFNCKPQVDILGAVFKLPFYALFKRKKFILLRQF